MWAGSRRVFVQRIGWLAGVLAAGFVLGAAVAGGGSSSGSTQSVAPDVGEIRVVGDESGPVSIRNGVGVGFSHDERGAVAAATNLVLALEQAAAVEQQQAVDAYGTLAASASRETLTAEMSLAWEALRDSVSANGPRAPSLFVRTIPVGHTIVRYSSEQATIDVWLLTLVAAEGLAEPLASWETATVELTWEDDDWKVWSATSSPGPTATWTSSAASTPVDEFLDSVEDFEGYRYATSAN